MRRASERFATALILLLIAGVARRDRAATPGLKRGLPGVDAALAAAAAARNPAAMRAYAVPEPGALFLMSIGGVGLLGYGLRRRMLGAA